MAEEKWIRVVQVRSGVGRPEKHRRILKSLGLGRPGYERVLPVTPTLWGMIRKVQHLVRVEPVPPPSAPSSHTSEASS